MGADLGLAIAKHAGARRDQPVARFQDIGDLIAKMVDAAIRVPLEKARDRRRLAKHAEELDLGVGKLDENRGHAMLGLVHRLRHGRAKRVAVDLGRSLEVRHGNGDMVQASDHRTGRPQVSI